MTEQAVRPGRRAALVLATLALALVAAATIALLPRGHMDPGVDGASTSQAAATSVTVSSVVVRNWPRIVEANGTVQAWQEASIGTLVGGLRIIDVEADVGDRVRKGQTLARFDLETVRAELAARAADLEGARAVAARADADAERAARLAPEGAVSQQDLLQSRTVAATSRAQFAAAQAHLESQALQIRQGVVVALDDGVISTRTATLGAVPPVGQELFRLIRRGRMQWLGEVDARWLSAVQVGQDVRLRLPDDSSASGRVARIAPSVSAQSRLGVVVVDIGPGSSARAGMFVSGVVEMSTAPALVVPAQCVVLRDGHEMVAVIEGREAVAKVALRRVSTGRRQGDEVEIVTGVETGERVVVRGAGFLGDGDLVKVTIASAQARNA